jgi:hypothetical protein
MSTDAFDIRTSPVLPPFANIRFGSKPWYTASFAGAFQISAGSSIVASMSRASKDTATDSFLVTPAP